MCVRQHCHVLCVQDGSLPLHHALASGNIEGALLLTEAMMGLSSDARLCQGLFSHPNLVRRLCTCSCQCR